ncbi:MAG: pseudouridine synthase [Legionella sp.]|nr:pseudouridine synthase [Legionella sp.]
MSGERLQKVLSQAGLGSRREMEVWIKNGVVQLNGKQAQLGDVVAPHDKIKVKGKLIKNPLNLPLRTRILIYHKPVGEISSRDDPKHKKTVFDNLPMLKRGRWIQVGRLDINTSGLLIFTNDGALANELMHPRYAIEREYAVRVHGRVKPEVEIALKNGVQLEDGMASFKSLVFQGGEAANTWYHVVLTEGRNREVRRLWESQGLEVSRLTRIRYGSLTMPRFLSRGKHMELSSDEVRTFVRSLSVDPNAIVLDKQDKKDKK